MIPQNVPSGFSLTSLVKKSANLLRRLDSLIVSGVSWVLFMFSIFLKYSPGGTIGNSPAIHRWERNTPLLC